MFARRFTCLAFVGLLAVPAAALSGCEDDAGAGDALAGEKEGTVRYIVHLKGDGPDLTAYIKAKGKGEDTTEIVKELRADARRRARPFKKALRESLDGRVVETWYLTRAVTVEVKVGNVENLKSMDGVERIEPDRLLGAAE